MTFAGRTRFRSGVLNAIVTGLGGEPQAWITIPFWNSIFLMVILVWIQTPFAMVIFSAALRGIPEETIEAARIDGAGELQIFFRIMVPQIMGTVVVVWTTITIIVLKVFDIVLAMTNGQWDTEVLANLMFDWMFRGGGDFGPRQHDCAVHHGGGHTDHDLEHSTIPERGGHAMNARIFGTKLTYGKLIAQSVLVFLILLWTVPTAGLFISSFRDKDQLIVSGWWTALITTERNERGRTGTADDQVERDGSFVIAGNFFGEPGRKSISTYGVRQTDLTAFEVGDGATFDDGTTFTLAADGSYEWVSEVPFEHQRGKRIFYVANIPRPSRWRTIARCSAPRGWGNLSSTH